MKKLILALLIIASLFSPFKCGREIYAKSGRIVEVDEEHDTVTFVDSVGYLWSFCEAEDWMLGDWCAVVFDTMGTDEIFDDEIVSVRYESWN